MRKGKHSYVFLRQNFALFLIAALVGILCGYSSIALREMIILLRGFCIGSGSEHVTDTLRIVPWWRILAAISFFAGVVGVITTLWAPAAKGHGVPEVMLAVSKNRSRIKPRIVFIKAIASAMTIASGGSAGQEGPIVQIGSALGSTIGQWLNLSVKKMRTLVACGAAAGIAATFNAPIAGIVFALDIILGEFNVINFSPVVVSAVSATVISRHYLGNHPVFEIPDFSISTYYDYGFSILLGVLCALGGYLFVKILYWFEDFFDYKIKINSMVKPVIGAFITGLIILKFPQVYGGGYDSMNLMIEGNAPLALVFMLIFVKIIATSFTLGSGGSGGIFAPSLYIGGAVGGCLGLAVNQMFPEITAPSGLYALLGMAGVVSAATHSPISAFLIIFEMTNNYDLILPLMLTVVIASLVAMAISPYSIYTLKLRRKGINLYSPRELNLMEQLTVSEYMSNELITLNASLNFEQSISAIGKTFQIWFPVVDEKQKIIGSISLIDIHDRIARGKGTGILSEFVANQKKIPTIAPDDSLNAAIEILDEYNIDTLLVEKNKRVTGIIRRENILSAYRKAVYETLMDNK